MATKQLRYKPQYYQKIRVSRGLRPVGEVFAMKFKGVGYIFGRVIRNDCAVAPCQEPRPWKRRPGLYLVYIYKGVSKRISQIPDLHRDNILIPPAIIVGTGWSRGLFVPVRQESLTPTDVRPVHCFWQNGFLVRGENTIEYVDEYGNLLPGRTEPCKLDGVGDHGSLELDVATALELPYKEWWVAE